MDGNVSLSVSECLSESDDDVKSSDSDSDSSFYATDDKVKPSVPPADLSSVNLPTGTAFLEVKKESKLERATRLPLVTVLNARSLYNKRENFRTYVTELGIELAVVSETWEREEESLKTLLNMETYKVTKDQKLKLESNLVAGVL